MRIRLLLKNSYFRSTQSKKYLIYQKFTFNFTKKIRNYHKIKKYSLNQEILKIKYDIKNVSLSYNKIIIIKNGFALFLCNNILYFNNVISVLGYYISMNFFQLKFYLIKTIVFSNINNGFLTIIIKPSINVLPDRKTAATITVLVFSERKILLKRTCLKVVQINSNLLSYNSVLFFQNIEVFFHKFYNNLHYHKIIPIGNYNYIPIFPNYLIGCFKNKTLTLLGNKYIFKNPNIEMIIKKLELINLNNTLYLEFDFNKVTKKEFNNCLLENEIIPNGFIISDELNLYSIVSIDNKQKNENINSNIILIINSIINEESTPRVNSASFTPIPYWLER